MSEKESVVPASDGCERITYELREWARDNTVQDKVLTTYPVQHPVHGTVESLLRIADRIDAAHERAVMSAMNDALYHANDENMAELGWVRKNKEHVISHATVEVTPHIDWLRMAGELDEFVEIVRGMAGDAE